MRIIMFIGFLITFYISYKVIKTNRRDIKELTQLYGDYYV